MKKERKVKDFFEMNKEEKETLFAQATREAIKRAHAAGRHTTHGDDKGVYQLYPDGHKVYIKKY